MGRFGDSFEEGRVAYQDSERLVFIYLRYWLEAPISVTVLVFLDGHIGGLRMGIWLEVVHNEFPVSCVFH